MFINKKNIFFPKLELIKNIYNIKEPIIFIKIPFTSICKNHILIFSGYITISYIPINILLSVTDINKIFSYFSKIPQTQSKLAKNIFFILKTILSIKSLAILVSSSHTCIILRKNNTKYTKITNFFYTGNFQKNNKLINNFFINLKKQKK